MIIETPHLLLQEAILADAPFIYDLLNSPGWLEYIGDRGIRSLDDAAQYIEDSLLARYAAGEMGLLKVILKRSGQALGLCGLMQRPHLSAPDIGFAILPAYEGQGYTSEAGAAVMAHARQVMGHEVILGITAPHNAGSQHLLQKLGLQPAGETLMPGMQETSTLFSSHPHINVSVAKE